MADLYCPYCGSRHIHQVGERYVCDECHSIFQVPGDGTIWLHLVDEYDNSDPTGLKWHDIEECDFLTANDLNSIVYHLKFN